MYAALHNYSLLRLSISLVLWSFPSHSQSFKKILLFDWRMAALQNCAGLCLIGEGDGNTLQCSCLENPGDGEPGGLPSMGSHRVGQDWSDLAAATACLTLAWISHRYTYVPSILNHPLISLSIPLLLKIGLTLIKFAFTSFHNILPFHLWLASFYTAQWDYLILM